MNTLTVNKKSSAAKRNVNLGQLQDAENTLSISKVRKIDHGSPELGQSISQLINGDLMALEIVDFASARFCETLVETVQRYPLDTTYLNNQAAKVLESQHNRQDRPDDYFAGAVSHPLLKEPTMLAAIQEIIDLLSTSGKPVSVAYEPNRKQYYCPAIIREFLASLKLHNDLGSREGKDWAPIQKVNKQWAFVLKLTSCKGGTTRWFPRQWKPEDELFFNREDNYSYNEAVVEGFSEVVFKGEIGTLIIFDCTCFHAVEQVTQGRRYTLGGFIGQLEEMGELIIWS